MIIWHPLYLYYDSIIIIIIDTIVYLTNGEYVQNYDERYRLMNHHYLELYCISIVRWTLGGYSTIFRHALFLEFSKHGRAPQTGWFNKFSCPKIIIWGCFFGIPFCEQTHRNTFTMVFCLRRNIGCWEVSIILHRHIPSWIAVHFDS